MSRGINNETEDGKLLPDEDEEFERELAEQERKRREEIEQTRLRIAEEKRQQEKRERDERDRRIAQDRLDLIKMKAGIAEGDEVIREVHEEKRELHGLEKAANFFYHEKWWIILAVFGLAVVIFMIIDAVNQVKPDLEILMICDNALGSDTSRELLEDKLEQYIPDRNGDGEVSVQIINCALNEYRNDMIYNNNSQKFFANIQQGKIIMVITDSNTDPDFQALMVNDLPEKMPNNEYIDEQGLSLNFGFLANELECEYLPNDIHLCLRRPVSTLDGSIEDMQEYYDKDFELFKSIADGLTEQARESDDKGLPTDPKPLDPALAVTDVSSSAADSKTDGE